MRSTLMGASVQALALGIAGAALAPGLAHAQQTIVVASGVTDNGAKTVGGTDSVTVQAGGTLSTSSNPSINWSTTSTDLRITNSGTIRSTANGGRAINASGGNNPRTVTLTNNSGGVIESQDDAFRVNVAPTGGTIRVDNFGIIRTTNGGQAIDFDAITGGATVIINNNAGAELRSFGQDAIRPGQGAVVTNAGLIFSDAAPYGNNDGVDWQQKSGTVNNLTGGTISGLRHGITSDINVTVNNAGTILGRNGSGIGSDGVGTVVNTGTITGVWNGVQADGDGDGIDIDGVGLVTNSGTIEGLSAAGVDSGGRPNSAEGVAMGGGTIVNNAGGTIFGAGNAILINHDTNPGGVADAATSITNAGTIRATTGRAISMVGVFADIITNSGTITGGTAGAIDMGDGNDTLNIEAGSVITGTVDGGAGSDVVRLGLLNIQAPGGSFAGSVNFENLRVVTGTWALSGSQAYANGIDVNSGSSISGSAATLSQSAIRNGGLVEINEAGNTAFTGTITGNGAVTKAGGGNLSLGTQSFAGGTNVMGGTLTITGSQASFGYYVDAGATLTSSRSQTIAGAAGAGFVGNSVTNRGTISNTDSGGRAIDLSGNGIINLNIGNEAGGLITSANDAIRINGNPTGVSVRIANAGTIQSTNGGQAIDLDAVSRGGSIEIINHATGIIKSFGQDAIRPGQGAVVTNAGLIFSDGPINNSFDGVDWQARSGTVNNQAGGVISGLRHGITSDVAVNVVNDGTITGRNGSGIGSDGTGTVVNRGRITGVWDGASTNGDGDGVDIDFIGTVRNFGTIEGLTAAGVDSGGRPNSAQGVAMGGGTIENAAGATIVGGAQAILINHDTNPGGVADGATTITNAGTIRGNAGEGILLVGDFADTITNSGLIAGSNVALDMGGGNDTLNVLNGASFTGTVNGGAGTDRVNLGGTGGSFGATTGFEQLAVNAGAWTLTAPTSYSGGTSVATGSSLTGNTTTLTGAIANSGSLVFNQATDGTVAATITGTGGLVKTGPAALTIGNQAYTGATSVNAGRLILAGNLASAVTVNNGGTLAGQGTVASLTVASGGTVAPGNSPGTITVTGNFTQAAGSTYAAEITASGTTDRIVVGGTATIANGAVLNITREAGASVIGTRYTLLTAAGGITGTYTIVQTPTGGTELRLVQGGNAVAVDVARTAAALASLTTTGNQGPVARSLATLGAGNAAYAAITLLPDDNAVRAGLDALSGEIHASTRTAVLRDAQTGQDATRTRLLDPETNSGLWGQYSGGSGTDDGGTVAASTRRSGWGLIGGVDFGMDGARIGVAGGFSKTDVNAAARLSSAEVETKQALVYGGGTFGAFALRTSLGYAWSSADVTRTIAFPGFVSFAVSDYKAETLHGMVEAGLPRPLLGGTVEPFVAGEFYRVDTDAFAETAGAASLNVRGGKQSFALGTLGLRAQTPIVEGLNARSRIGWQHAFGDAQPQSTMQFIAGGPAFQVTGAGLSRDAAVVTLDLAWKPSERLTITSGYAGSIGGDSDDSRLRVMVSMGF